MRAPRTRTTALEDAQARRSTSIGALAKELNTSESGLYGIAARERWVETGKAARVGKRIIVHFETYAPMIGFEPEPAQTAENAKRAGMEARSERVGNEPRARHETQVAA